MSKQSLLPPHVSTATLPRLAEWLQGLSGGVGGKGGSLTAGITLAVDRGHPEV